MIFLLRILGPDTTHPLGFLLSIFARLQSIEAVDKVYALRGLANNPRAASIIPDYAKHKREVFIDVAVILLESREDAIFILPYAGMISAQSHLLTWVPD